MPLYALGDLRPNEIGYAERTTNYVLADTGPVTVPALSVAITIVAGSPVMVEAFCAAFTNSTLGAVSYLSLQEDGVTLPGCSIFAYSAAANTGQPGAVLRARCSTAGAHTYTLQAGSFSGIATVAASTFIRVSRV